MKDLLDLLADTLLDVSGLVEDARENLAHKELDIMCGNLHMAVEKAELLQALLIAAAAMPYPKEGM